MNPKEQYLQFCEAQPLAPIFAQGWYLDAAPDGQQWEVALATDEHGRVLAAMPYCLKTKWGFQYSVMPLFVKHLGPFLSAEALPLSRQHQVMAELISQLPRLDGFSASFSPHIGNWLPFYWQGYRQTTYYTYQLNLQDPSLEQRINRNMQRNLRKAAAQLKLRHDLPLAELHRLIGLSFGRQSKALPYTWPQLERHHQALVDHQAQQLFFAEDEQGRVHSAACLIWDRHAAYYHLSGDDPNLRAAGGGIWLVWQAIQYARDVLKLPVFDFEGSMLPAVEAIRRQFGAQQVPYFYVWKAHSKVFKWLKGW